MNSLPSKPTISLPDWAQPMSRMACSLEVAGPLAMFSRADSPAERLTYPIMPPTAAIGALESVFWKPQMRWLPYAIEVLSPLQEIAIRRNERLTKPKNLGDRDQRLTVFLKDARYRIYAVIDATDKGPESIKHKKQFDARVKRGQQFRPVYLGAEECMATYVGEPTDLPALEGFTLNAGLLPHNVNYQAEFGNGPVWEFYQASVDNGLMRIPQFGIDRTGSTGVSLSGITTIRPQQERTAS